MVGETFRQDAASVVNAETYISGFFRSHSRHLFVRIYSQIILNVVFSPSSVSHPLKRWGEQQQEQSGSNGTYDEYGVKRGEGADIVRHVCQVFATATSLLISSFSIACHSAQHHALSQYSGTKTAIMHALLHN